ncbi:transcription elongation factor Elf1 like-domain-containing protein [Cercophora newfieldiana]|uniref:Transcription elongation factor 1 homolog n=1 Tax=Cercophora newfieldiana TaxID=92897 RepID=A0AA40CWP8_9PEZI|nr:transcription elongation factor Elf1 like-domain-containing protein [Cercophora newfieldiana]
MGKRKKSSRKPQGPRKNEPLATVFTCLFCNHERSVSVKLDKKAGVGQLDCKTCGQKFQCGINYLSAAVDVYSEWVDAADAVAHDGGGEDVQPSSSRGRLSSGRPGASKGKADAYDDDDDEDRGGYEGEDVVADDDDYE